MTSTTYTASSVNQFTGAYIGSTSLVWDNNGNLTSGDTRNLRRWGLQPMSSSTPVVPQSAQ